MSSRLDSAPSLDPDFSRRLESALQLADRERRRRQAVRRVQRALPVILLVGPIVAWRLILVTPGSAHVAINALAWLTFILDVGVHVDAAALSYLGLQALPTMVGALLLILISASLLSGSRGRH
jgi:hypothetical protein